MFKIILITVLFNAGLGLGKHSSMTAMKEGKYKTQRPELEFEKGYQLLCSTLKDEQLRGVKGKSNV